MTAEHFDLVVIGGGIHGAGVAQAAAAKGHSVLVLEREALANATSSRSSKLIHGGLRYLESGQLSLVRECLRERELLLRNAPELVQLRPFYVPIYRHSRRQRWQLRTGLSLYSILGGLRKNTRFTSVPRQKWSDLDGLDTGELKAVYQYWDGQTDDVALTHGVMNSALELGATLHMPAVLEHAALKDDGCIVQYTHKGRQRECRATTIVNAAGPWVNDVLSRISPPTPQRQVQWVQGSHILLPGQITQGIYYCEAPGDRRPVFVMPWQGQLMVGTTETTYYGDIDRVHPTPAERTYLLETLSYYFPHFRSEQTARISAAFAGLRVLPDGAGNVAARRRDTTLHTNNDKRPQILSIYGGKLTAYRATAEQVMRRLAPRLPKRTAVANTARLPLKPAHITSG